MSGFCAQNTRKRPGSDDKSASLPKTQRFVFLGSQSKNQKPKKIEQKPKLIFEFLSIPGHTNNE
jgi:hypothetical protein